MRNKKTALTLAIALTMTGVMTTSVLAAAQPSNTVGSTISAASENLPFVRQSIKVDGTDMTYYDLGTKHHGQDIVIIHGALCNADSMLPYAQLWAKTNHVIDVDMPGHYTDNGQQQSTIDGITAKIAGFIKELQQKGIVHGKPIVMGWSLGGTVTLDLAVNYKDTIKEGVLISSAPLWHIPSMAAPDDATAYAIDNSLFTSLFSPELDASVSGKILDELSTIGANHDAFNADIQSVQNFDLTSKLKDIKIPIKIFYGDTDGLASADTEKLMTDNIKKSEIYTAKGKGHMVVVEDPELVYNAVKDLLK